MLALLAILPWGAGPDATVVTSTATSGVVVAGELKAPEIQAGQCFGSALAAPSSVPALGRPVITKAEAGQRVDGLSHEVPTLNPRDMFERLTRTLSDPRIRPN